MKIFAICGSLRPESSNMTILKSMRQYLPDDAVYDIYPSIALLPHFDPALNDTNTPDPVIAFRKMVAEADGVVICSPEYAFGIPGSMKNALDWTVSSGEFTDKPVALITASSSGHHAHAALSLVLRTMSASLPETNALLISYVRTKIDGGGIKSAETADAIRKLLVSFVAAVASYKPYT